MNGDVMPASLIRVLFLFANTIPGTSRVTISEVEANDRTQMTVSDSGHKKNAVYFGFPALVPSLTPSLHV